jgi:hypothetical protein
MLLLNYLPGLGSERFENLTEVSEVKVHMIVSQPLDYLPECRNSPRSVSSKSGTWAFLPSSSFDNDAA